MTDPQRHKLVIGTAVMIVLCMVLYFIVFGFQSFDPKSLLVVAGFFAVAWKISNIKHKHHPMV